MKKLRHPGGEAFLGLLIGKARVGGAKLQIGHQSIKQPAAGFNHHKAALLHFLWGNGQPDAKGILEGTAHNITNGLGGMGIKGIGCHHVSPAFRRKFAYQKCCPGLPSGRGNHPSAG